MLSRIDIYLRPIEKILTESFAAQGADVWEMFANTESDLPGDIGGLFRNLRHRLERLKETQAGDGDAAECIFLCGQLAGKLDALANQRAAESLMANLGGNLTPAEYAQTDLSAIARFLAVRDKIMRRVADFTLKVILGLVVLLSLGMLLGLI